MDKVSSFSERTFLYLSFLAYFLSCLTAVIYEPDMQVWSGLDLLFRGVVTSVFFPLSILFPDQSFRALWNNFYLGPFAFFANVLAAMTVLLVWFRWQAKLALLLSILSLLVACDAIILLYRPIPHFITIYKIGGGLYLWFLSLFFLLISAVFLNRRKSSSTGKVESE